MFIHTLIERKDVDLDELINQLKTNEKFVNNAIEQLGSIEYSFVVYCVEQQIALIKSLQEDQDSNLPPLEEDPNDPCLPCEKKDDSELPDLTW